MGKAERAESKEQYMRGFLDGRKSMQKDLDWIPENKRKPKRKISDWQKFIKANSSKKKFKFANGKLKLKTMGIAYRKTAAYKRNKKK
tara:strand:+ start:19 stop:279 length:261 start_codon:yes stop_codon:yes gene_type:complete